MDKNECMDLRISLFDIQYRFSPTLILCKDNLWYTNTSFSSLICIDHAYLTLQFFLCEWQLIWFAITFREWGPQDVRINISKCFYMVKIWSNSLVNCKVSSESIGTKTWTRCINTTNWLSKLLLRRANHMDKRICFGVIFTFLDKNGSLMQCTEILGH